MEEGQSSGTKNNKQVVLTLERNVEQSGGTLVGKILSSKSLNVPTVVSMIKKSWQLDDEMEIHELDRSQLIFLFRFHHVKDYARVLLGRPWSIQGCLLNLQVWEDLTVLEDIKFGEAPFWVQFHGLPLEAFENGNAKVLGDTVGEAVMYEKPKVEGRLGRGFIRVRSLIQLTDPLSHGFWVPRNQKPLAWVTVKYERLPDFCYIYGCIGHKESGYRASEGSDRGDHGERAFDSWLNTVDLRTFTDVVEVCKDTWCEASFLEEKTPTTKARRSWTPVLTAPIGHRPDSRDPLCQNLFRSATEHADQLTLRLSVGNSTDGDMLGVQKAPVDQRTFNADDEKIPCDLPLTQSDMLMCSPHSVEKTHAVDLVHSLNTVGPMVEKAQSEGPADVVKSSPTAFESELGDHVEFPNELEIGHTSLIPFNGLSPISAISKSFMGCHLKRQLEDSEDHPAVTKRQRKLSFEEHVITQPVCSPAKQKQCGRRKNCRALKSLIRSQPLVKQPEEIGGDLINKEIDFPAEWLNGNVGANETEFSSSTQNAGGWMGPTTGAP
ncbi:hypothetical protein QN277_000434 [Acacia crassicarpa]|uniref:DUF4283 domain-containing protein n=1 Tax=Acacia crassicarpa TaxID=499986 RepID=A0AAE1TH57_9FABA|nr:hypothetical protein QN277_000434 [Acacia crassicarpa]